MEMLHDLARFVVAVVSHWQAYVTGGAVTGVVTLIERLTAWKLPKWAFAALFVGVFLLASFFLTWRDEYLRANTLQATLNQHPVQPQFQINIPPITLPPQTPSGKTPPIIIRMDSAAIAKQVEAIEREHEEKSHSPLKKEILDLSKQLRLFAAEHEKEQPKIPPGMRGPGPRFRNTPEWQKYQADQKQFVTESRAQFTQKFESQITSVLAQLKDKDIDVDNVPSLCSSNNAFSPSTIQQCGAQLRVFVDEVE
jgi:hypothetical protein